MNAATEGWTDGVSVIIRRNIDRSGRWTLISTTHRLSPVRLEA